MVGEPIAQPMADLLADHEIPISGFAARQLRPDMIEDASLIVAAARDHRSAVVRLVPGAVHRTFTLLELARLTSTLAIPAAEDLVARVEALPARAAGQRSMHLNHRDPDDIIDPYRRRRPVYRKSFAAIDDAVTRLVAALTSDRVRQRR